MLLFIKITATSSELANRYNLSFPDQANFTPQQVIYGDDNPLCPIISENDPEKLLLIRWGLDLRKDDQVLPEKVFILPIMPIETTQEINFPKGFQRCLIPVNGFYDHSIDEKDEIDQYEISLEDDSIFFLAGMCGTFFDPLSEQSIDFFVILTKTTYAIMPLLCNITRMPIAVKNAKEWLENGKLEVIEDFKVEYIDPEQAMTMFTTPDEDENDSLPDQEEDPKKRA